MRRSSISRSGHRRVRNRARAEYADHIGLWRHELQDWVPERVFDVHVHLGPPEIVGAVSPARASQALCTFTDLTWEELQAIYRGLYRGKVLEAIVAFPFPQYEVDLDAGNAYMIDLMVRERGVRGFMLAHPTDTAHVRTAWRRAEAAGVRFRGVKPYYDRLGKSNFETVLAEFLPADLLEFMDERGLAMMLHTSSIGVGDPAIRGELRRICSAYPNITIILAHMGRYTEPRQFADFMASGLLDECPALCLEMSSVSVSCVYEAVLARRELWGRLLFGSDLPFGLITGVEQWSDSRGAVFVSRDTYPWSDPDLQAERGEQRSRLTYNTYHCIQALKDAFEDLGIFGHEAESLKQAIFRNNAERILA